MYYYLKQPIIRFDQKKYLSLLIFLMPALNFLGGVSIDIYAPSMPSLAAYFNVSTFVIKNSISMTILGWGFGALFFGIVIDNIGRKKTFLFALFLYALASILTPLCSNISEFMVLRFLQGFATMAIAIGCRAVIADNLTGAKFNIAVVYTSIGYGLGPVIGPFLGGLLQHYFDWQSIFITLALLSFSLFLITLFFIHESLAQKQILHPKAVIQRYSFIIKNKKFLAGVILLGITQTQMLLYPILGPFIIENYLHLSAIVYGNTALLAGLGYLSGGIINRMLLKNISIPKSAFIGCLVLMLALLLAGLFSIIETMKLFTIIIPIILINLSAGFIFSNTMATNLKLFPNTVGTMMSIQMLLLAFITALGIFIASHIHITALLTLALIYLVLGMLTFCFASIVFKLNILGALK